MPESKTVKLCLSIRAIEQADVNIVSTTIPAVNLSRVRYVKFWYILQKDNRFVDYYNFIPV